MTQRPLMSLPVLDLLVVFIRHFELTDSIVVPLFDLTSS